MKIAVSGKGGVGKTTFSSLLIRSLNDQGKHVLAIDADPDANLAAAVGIENAGEITPIAEMKELIFERTGAQPGTIGGFFKLNPKVDDLPDALSAKLDNIKLMEDSGASAVVLYSLFEEQLRRDRLELNQHLEHGTDSFAEALTYFPEPDEFTLGPEEYLKHISAAKEAVKMPVIASLNGTTRGGWVRYAKRMEDAGADALELNVYLIPTDPYATSLDVERRYLDLLSAVVESVDIPAIEPEDGMSHRFEIEDEDFAIARKTAGVKLEMEIDGKKYTIDIPKDPHG